MSSLCTCAAFKPFFCTNTYDLTSTAYLSAVWLFRYSRYVNAYLKATHNIITCFTSNNFLILLLFPVLSNPLGHQLPRLY